MKTIIFNKHKFQISNEGILFWFDKQIAIISDLHLEKGSSFAHSGQFLPPYDSEETLKKILNTIKDHQIKKIILLGDTFHDKNAISRMSEKVTFLFRSLIENYEVIFVADPCTDRTIEIIKSQAKQQGFIKLILMSVY